ncbi:MAG: hypothetical protein ACP5VQ_05755 [Phycisphaerae bacterium]
MLIAGIDEAGYGPLLGPLVVSAAAFRFPEPLNVSDITPAQQLWKKLFPMVVAKPPVKSGALIIADSKVVHRLSAGDKYLERAVLVMLRLLPNAAPAPANWNDLLARLSNSPGAAQETAPPWQCNAPVPAFGESGSIAIAANMLRSVIGGGNTPPAGLWTRVLDVPEFNRLVAATANKASVLTSITMMHARNLHDRFHESDLLLFVDKQGGRDHYTRLLLRTFPDWPLKVMLESAPESRYLISTSRGKTLLIFREKAEQHCLATALASMVCKYVRELYMTMFNQWWTRCIPGLEPTAGYYTDAMRWLARAEPEFHRLGFKREMVVRIK